MNKTTTKTPTKSKAPATTRRKPTTEPPPAVRTSPEAPAVRTTDAPAATAKFVRVRLDRLTPATLNDKVYKPVRPDDPATRALADNMRRLGWLGAMAVTTDGVIVSGHRRRVAAQLAGIAEVNAEVLPITSADPRFPDYLVTYNAQRVKTAQEEIREAIARTSPEDAHNALLAHRATEDAKAYRRVEASGLRVLPATAAARRSAITGPKRPMLDAAVAILNQYRGYWPLTLRQIHYRMLTRNVLRNAAKPNSLYVNTQKSYKDLSDLLTRARLLGEVPWESMHDPTRPKTEWRQWDGVGPYAREQLDTFLGSYKRNLLRTQPAYVEIVVEKLTVHDIAKRAAGHFHVPVGVGRGYTSVTSLEATAERFRASGKDRFVLLIAGDLDPEGEDICRSWAASLHDEHGIANITPVKVGVNPDQVQKYNLAPLPMKASSSRAAGFAAAHGNSVYELEAFEPDQLQAIIRDAIRGVLDLERFAEEQRRESEDARQLMACRAKVQELLAGVDFGDAAPSLSTA